MLCPDWGAEAAEGPKLIKAVSNYCVGLDHHREDVSKDWFFPQRKFCTIATQ